MTRRATLTDIAKDCGVSVRSVSNVVNDQPHVSKALKDKVLASCRKLGYQPNIAARNLRSGRSGMIGLIVPDVGHPYFAALARAVIDAARDEGLGVLVDHSGGTRDGEAAALIRANFQGQFDGVIISPVATPPEEIAEQMSTKCVFLGAYADQEGLPHVGIDNRAAAEAATRHLIEGGATRIAAVGLRDRDSMADLRLAGYRAALEGAGLTVSDDLLFTVSGPDRAAGAQAASAIAAMRKRPDAVFCFTDLLALGLMQGLQAIGLRVPQDIAVMGFDDLEEGAYATPSLSSVALDREALAREAVRMLAGEAMRQVLPHQVLKRGSTRSS